MAIQKMPNGCELRDQLGRDWAIQVKPVGSADDAWMYLKGVRDLQVNIETNDTDSTTIDMDGWTGTTKISRSLTITAEGKFVVVEGLAVLEKSQQLLKVTGEEIGSNGTIDVRVWRTDVDEGWEVTATNGFTTSGGREDLRQFTSTLTSNCAPVRIHSVQEGAATKESVVIDMAEYLGVLNAAAAKGDTDEDTEDTGALPGVGAGVEPGAGA